nr:MAG TPA: hypothetical protein [Caudoviricetes sp.]
MLLHNILKEYRICIYILRNLYIHPHDLRHMISGTLSYCPTSVSVILLCLTLACICVNSQLKFTK